MRRVLFIGFSLAFGSFASPVVGQDARSTPQPVRAARLGSPIGISNNSQTDQDVTPAGLLTPGQDASAIPTPMPVPPGGMPMTGGTPLLAPRPVPSTPSVTEMRTPDGSMGIPVYPPGYPGYPGYPAITGIPTLAPSGVPDGVYPPTGLEPPVVDCPTGIPAVDRVSSCNRWWTSAEYLMWWTRGMQVPTLLTTSSPQFNGIPGQGNTTSLFGGDVGNTYHGGGRFSLGRWFCDDPTWGVEGRIFFLGDSDSSFAANSNQYPVLARPFFNVNNPVGQFSELIATPGLATGSALIKTETSLWGAEANARRVLFGSVNGGGFELDAIVGYRFVDLNEHLSIEEAFQRTPNSNMSIGTPAISGNVTDLFHTTNLFNGGQIGLASSYQTGRWSIDGRATVAFGDLEQTAVINGGQTLVFANGVTEKFAGGLLALPGANIGTYHHSQFAVLPEVSLNVGYQITSHLRAFIGYDFLFLSNALRPGGAIDTSLDAARIPNFPLAGNPSPLSGAPRPGPYFTTSDFFAQGINFGLQFRW